MGVTAGDRWAHPRHHYSHVVEVRPRQILAPQYRVAVGIPRRVLLGHYWGVLRLLLPVALLGVLAVGLLVRAGTVCLGRPRRGRRRRPPSDPARCGTPPPPSRCPRGPRRAAGSRS